MLVSPVVLATSVSEARWTKGLEFRGAIGIKGALRL